MFPGPWHMPPTPPFPPSSCCPAAARMQQLEGELAPLYEQQVAQAQLAAEAMAAAAAAADAEAAAASATAEHVHHIDGVAPAEYTAHASAAPISGYGASASGLFSGSHLQLVPPTPMLQQQVAKQQRRLQHRAAEQQAHMGVSSTEASQQHMPAHQHLLPLNLSGPLPHQGGAVEVAAAVSRGGGSDESLCPVLLPEAVNSPVLQDSGPGSPLSTASSSALPAAELLMSRELMDLDLVDDDDAEEEDDGGIFPQHIMANTGQARSPGCGVRISYARFSLGTDSLSPLLAGAARHQHQAPQQQDKAGWSQDLGDGGGGAAGAAGAAASASSVCESAEGASAYWRGLSLSGKGPTAGVSPSSSSHADLDTLHPQDEQDTPKCDWTNTAGAAHHHQQHSPGGAASSAGGAGAAAAAAAAAAEGSESGKSPRTVGSGEQHGQLQQPGSAECLSSAKPRRLTFAAAASVDSRGSTSMLAPHADTPLLDTGSSFSISSGEDAGDDAQSAAANPLQQQQAASDTMAALRQRFAQMRGER